jgi:predicted nucleic acid-binding protein
VVPPLWFYEIGNGLLMALRRKRITSDQNGGFLVWLKALPIDVTEQSPDRVLEVVTLARAQSLTNYDAAYLGLALRLKLPLATTDGNLRKIAAAAGVALFAI